MDELEPIEFKKLDTKDFLNKEIPIRGIEIADYFNPPENARYFQIVIEKQLSEQILFNEEDVKDFCDCINKFFKEKKITALINLPHYLEFSLVTPKRKTIFCCFCETEYSNDELNQFYKYKKFKDK